MKWIIEEAKKIHTLKNIVILENPETRQLLDNLLLKKFYPAINKHLHETGYRELDNPKIETKLVYELVRSILFMMTDDFGYTFFRGEFECELDCWMLTRTFWLGLPRDTDPDFLFRILSDERFEGNPPTLSIEESPLDPEWNIYYLITLHSGTGTSWSPGGGVEHALQTIKSVIRTSAEMYDISMIEGFSDMADVEIFLNTAYAAFES